MPRYNAHTNGFMCVVIHAPLFSAFMILSELLTANTAATSILIVFAAIVIRCAVVHVSEERGALAGGGCGYGAADNG